MSIGLAVTCGPNDHELATSAAAPVNARQVADRISATGWPSRGRAWSFDAFAVSIATTLPNMKPAARHHRAALRSLVHRSSHLFAAEAVLLHQPVQGGPVDARESRGL